VRWQGFEILFVISASHLGSQRTDSHEILSVKIFRKSVAKIQVSSNSEENDGYFT